MYWMVIILFIKYIESIYLFMNKYINKTYVINLEKRTDRWYNINKSFENINMQLTRWDAVYGKEMKEKEIEKNTTRTCYYFCSPSMIGCWLSHCRLWKHIVKNREDKVLILEDDSYPVKNFNNKVDKYFKQVPGNWDILFLGSFGSCDNSVFEKNFFYLYGGHKNRPVYIDGKKQPNIIRPGFPLGLHAYMLSYKGAKKLIETKLFDKANYHIDHELATKIVNDKKFNVYAFTPPLINQQMESAYSDNQLTTHPMFSKLASNLYISDQHTLDAFSATIVFELRKFRFTFSVMNLSLILLSFIIGMTGNNISNYYLLLIFFYYLLEIKQVDKKNRRDIMVEMTFVFLFAFIGNQLKIILTNKYNKL